MLSLIHIFGQKVRIMHEGNVVYGAVRNHGSLNKKELEITDIIIDIGAVSREDACLLYTSRCV